MSAQAQPLLRWFRFEHLKPELQGTSKAFSDLAHQLARDLPDNDESREMMRKLLEAKDCAVRAELAGMPPSSRAPG